MSSRHTETCECQHGDEPMHVEGPPDDLTLQPWNEQGTPYDPRACEAAAVGGGYWQPWLFEVGN